MMPRSDNIKSMNVVLYHAVLKYKLHVLFSGRICREITNKLLYIAGGHDDDSFIHYSAEYLADCTNGCAYAAVLCLSSSLSVIYVSWLNGAS